MARGDPGEGRRRADELREAIEEAREGTGSPSSPHEFVEEQMRERAEAEEREHAADEEQQGDEG